MTKTTLNLDTLTVTTFDTSSEATVSLNAAATLVNCGGCNSTRLTCSTNLC